MRVELDEALSALHLSVTKQNIEIREMELEYIYLVQELRNILFTYPELLPEKRDYLLDRIERLLGE